MRTQNWGIMYSKFKACVLQIQISCTRNSSIPYSIAKLCVLEIQLLCTWNSITMPKRGKERDVETRHRKEEKGMGEWRRGVEREGEKL